MKMLLLLHIMFFFFSISSVLGKYASYEDFVSLNFILLFGASIAIMFFYSIAWQFILQRTSLVMAYSNRGIVVIWGIVWGVLLFDDILNFATIAATLIIIAGIALVGVGGGEKSE